MPGEKGRVGWANTALFRDIVKNFGWVQRGPIDENIPCKKCGKYQKGTWKEHGVDALFTIKCPYQNRNRAIIVDGKRYTMESVGGPKKLYTWLRDTIKTTIHARESIDILEKERNLPENTLFDTAMVVWDCHEDWDNQKAKEWIKGINLNTQAIPPIMGFLTTKEFLNRLQTLEQFKKSVAELQFLYTADRNPKWSKVMTPEVLHSSIFAVRYKKYSSTKWDYGAFYFDNSDQSNISFLIHYLSFSGLLTHESIEVLIPCQKNEIEIFQTHLESSFDDHDGFGEQTILNCVRVATSIFDS